jgi:hypothetical protein
LVAEVGAEVVDAAGAGALEEVPGEAEEPLEAVAGCNVAPVLVAALAVVLVVQAAVLNAVDSDRVCHLIEVQGPARHTLVRG